MDLKNTARDLDITVGELSFVRGIDAIRQDIEMGLRTWLAETPYDRNVGLPYLQVIFRRGVTRQAVQFIIDQAIRSRTGVTDVFDLELTLDQQTRDLVGTARVVSDGQDVQVDIIV